MTSTQPGAKPDFDLSKESAAIGRVFDTVGEHLAACNNGIAQVVVHAAQIGEEMRNKDLKSSMAEITPILDHCQGLLSDFEREGTFLDDLEQAIIATQVPLCDLTRTIRMIQMVSVNARVVTAGIDTSEDLSVFTNDLGELIAQMSRVTQVFGNLIEKLATKVHADREQHCRFMEDQGRQLRLTVSRLPADLEQISHLGAEADRIQQSVARDAAAMQQSVARAVPLLQVGDATRQRLEHVTQIPERIDPSVRGSVVEAYLRGDLLDAAIVQLEADTSHMREELADIARSTAMIVQHLAGNPYEGQTNDVARLKRVIKETVDLLADCGASRAHSACLRDESRASLDELSACLSDLDDIALAAAWVSLNAAISCVRLGDDGIALALIAEQVRELNRDITRHTRRIVSLISDGKAKFDHSSQTRSDGALSFAEFREHFSSTLTQLEEANGEAETLRGRLFETATEVEGRMDAVQLQTAEIYPIIGELLKQATPERCALDEDSLPPPECFQSARALLTMQAERDVFDAVMSRLPNTEACHQYGSGYR